MLSTYYDTNSVKGAVSAKQHRALIGGMWEEIGKLQLQYLVDDGLTPKMRLLDIGCGCLRGGVHFVRYLEKGNYYGLDMSQALLDVGYEDELTALGLQDRLPRENLICTPDFDMSSVGKTVDAAIALSVFTHLPLNHIKLCLARLTPVMRPGGRFYATFFVVPDGKNWIDPLTHTPGGIVTHPTQDPYHYRPNDIEHMTSEMPWKLDRLTGWNHPRNQEIAVFERL